MPEVMRQTRQLQAQLTPLDKGQQPRMGCINAAPNPQISIITGVVVGQVQILLRDEVFEKGQGLEENLLGNVEQITPVEIHWHRIGFVEANDLHQVFGCVG